MVEYIDRQAAIDALGEEPEIWCETDEEAATRSQWEMDKAAIESVQPADVRPVIHGRWVKVGGFFTPGGDPVWQCSECGKGRHVYGIEHGTYGADVSDGQWVACPNCMAIMEESK